MRRCESSRTFPGALRYVCAVTNTTRVAPPLTITEEEIDFGIDVLNWVLSEIGEMCD